MVARMTVMMIQGNDTICDAIKYGEMYAGEIYTAKDGHRHALMISTRPIYKSEKEAIKAMEELVEELKDINLKKDIEMSETKTRPSPPPGPPGRVIREGDTGPRCAICKSSLYKEHWWSRRTSNCVNPECTNYGR